MGAYDEITTGFMKYFSIIERLKPQVIERGLEYIHLGKGDFDLQFFKMPYLFREVIYRTIKKNYFPYTHPAGKEDTRHLLAIMESLSLPEGVEYNYREITLAIGAAQALYLVLTTIFKDDNTSKIILFEPTYISHLDLLQELGVEPILFDLDGRKGFQITNEILAKIENTLAKDSRVKAILVVNPSFPFGRYVEQPILEQLLKITEKYGVFLILDESYISLNLIDKPYRKRTLLKKADYLIKIRTFSKTLALAGIRIGYILANRTLSKEFASRNEIMIGCPPTWIEPLIDLYSLAVIHHRERLDPLSILEIVKYSKRKFEIISPCLKNLDDLYEDARTYKYKLLYLKQLVVDMIRDSRSLGYLEPQAGINMGIFIKKKLDDFQLMEQIFLDTGVVLTPGGVFNIKEQYPWFRLTFAVEPNTLRRGLSRLIRYVDNL